VSAGIRPGRLGFGLVGAGKVGAVLAAALRSADHAVVGYHAVSAESVSRAETLLPEVPNLELPELLRRSEAVILAVPGDELTSLVSGLASAGHWRAGQLVVHTVARFGVDVLTPAREAGAIPLAVHPALEFTGTSLDLRRLDGASFAVTSDPLMLPVAQALVVEMGAEPVVVEEEDRALYAAALDLAADPLGTVAATAWEALRAAGVEDPSRMMESLLRSGVENALMAGPHAGERVAAARSAETVASDVRALRGAEALGPDGVARGRGLSDGPARAEDGESPAGVVSDDEAADGTVDDVPATGALAEAGTPAVGVYAALVRAATARALARGVITGDRAAAVLDALDS
jgi:predicted short-subunit dehydrogenase-like oxidoreductase (DUF2520 family)